MPTLQTGPLIRYIIRMAGTRAAPFQMPVREWFGRPAAGVLRGLATAVATALALAGCSERERPVFGPDPDASDGIGPVTFIDVPGQADTIVRAGPGLGVSGRTVDVDGVDTLYVEVLGGNEQFQPFIGQSDTVRFSYPISTSGHMGDTLFVLIFGTDELGNRGDTAIRRLIIR